MTRVESLANRHSRIVAQFPVELPAAHIDRIDLRSPRPQQTIRKTAGRSAEVRAYEARGGNRKGLQRALKLQSSAAGIARSREYFHARIGSDGLPGFLRLPAVDQNLARHDERLRLFTRIGCAMFDHPEIEALFAHCVQDFRATIRSAISCSRWARLP